MVDSPQEYLLNNFLDKEFQMMLFPLHFHQTICLQSKFRILHGFVTPNTLFNQSLCVLGAVLVVLDNVMRCIITIRNFYLMPNPIPLFNDLYVFGVFIDLIIYGVFSIVVAFVNIRQGQRNVELILRIQRAYIVLREDDKGISRFGRNNWIYVTLLVSAYVLMLFNVLVFVNFLDLLWYVFVIYFDANILFGTRIINFLACELKMLKRELEKFGTRNSNQICSSENISEHGKNLFRSYLDITKAFQLSEQIFQASILYLIIEVFGHYLYSVQNAISIQLVTHLFDEISLVGAYVIVLQCSWSVKNFVLLGCLCVACQQYYQAAVDVEATSAMLLNEENTPKCVVVRRLCKNILRASSCSSALCAGGVIEVCATLPLRQLQLLATYTVVLLQFAFL